MFRTRDNGCWSGTIRRELPREDKIVNVRRSRHGAGVLACYGAIRECSWGLWLSEPERNTRIWQDIEGLIGAHEVGNSITAADLDGCPPIARNSIRPSAGTLAPAGPVKVQGQRSNAVGLELSCLGGPSSRTVHHHSTIQRGVGETYEGRSLLPQHRAS